MVIKPIKFSSLEETTTTFASFTVFFSGDDSATTGTQEHPIESIAVLDTFDIQEEQLSDISLYPTITYLSRQAPNVSRHFKRRAVLFTLRSEVLYRRNYEPHGRPWLWVVPRSLQRDINCRIMMSTLQGTLDLPKRIFE